MSRRKPPKRQAPVDPQARYDAAGSGRRISHWRPPASGPQKALEGFERIRSRVHDAVRNDWAAESSTQKWVTNLVGTGIQPVFKDRAHRDVWDAWVPKADADGVLDAYGLQVLMGRALFDGGEAFLRRRPRSSTSPLDIPVQVQVIEGDYCPMLDADVWPGLPAGNTIRQGIERSKYGERTAYWFYKEHPGDGFQSIGGQDLIRVAASQVAHVYEVDRPGQLRGVSSLATILTRLRSAGDLEDASLDRQKIANLFALFVTRPMPPDEQDIDPLTGLPKFYGTAGLPVAGLEPGISQTLLPGEDVKFASPPGSGTGFGEFMRAIHGGTAAGQGLPYELMSGDIKDTNDRTLRVLINEFRRYCQQRQWITLIPLGCQRMLDWCMEAAVLVGALPRAQLAAARKPTWTPQGWEYIHPTQDAEGKKLLLEMGVLSKTQIITERGNVPEEVFEQRAADAEAEDRLGLTLEEPAPAAPAKPPTEPPHHAMTVDQIVALARPQSQQGAPAHDAALAAMAQVMAQVQAQSAALGQALQAIAQSLADRNTVVNVAAPEVNIEPAQIHVAPPDVHVAAPVVNIEPAQVNVTNKVEPAAVSVDVNLPERQTTSEIQRDGQGNIINVTQTERTLQ